MEKKSNEFTTKNNETKNRFIRINISAACKTMGYSRDSYYRFQELYEKGGEEALLDMTRKKPIIANRVDPKVEKVVLDMAIEYPDGQLRVSNELKKEGVMVSLGGVRSIWLLRNDLNNMKSTS